MTGAFFPIFLLIPLFICQPAAAGTPALIQAENYFGAMPATVPEPGSPFTYSGGDLCVFSTSLSASIDGAAFARIAGEADVVYMGESHDRLPHHLAQLEALKAMYAARGARVAVGFEMLNSTLQPALDRYASGAATEEEFLREADWAREWGFDFALYRPIFDFIRANKLRALALNLPKKIVSKIARGGLAALSPEEAAFIPAGFSVSSDERYIAHLKGTFDGHMGNMFTFDNYLAAMSAWNEAMGARLAGFINSNPGWAALAVAGSGHVLYNAGIPASVAKRAAGLRHASFYPLDAACPETLPPADAGLADYVRYFPPSQDGGSR